MAIMHVSACLAGRFQPRSSAAGTAFFPDFLPREVEKIRDLPAREMAKRIQRLPVQVSFSESSILSSCVMPVVQSRSRPLVLLHSFDSSCLEWRYAYPLLESYGLEAWALDVLGWGFSDLEPLPPSSLTVAAKREHLYQFWRSYIKRPMILVGPSLGAAVAIDFATHYPEAVSKFILIGASVYAEGTGDLAKLPRPVAYAGVSLLKTKPLRLYASYLANNGAPIQTIIENANIGSLHCLLPWWEDATVDFMASGGYKVSSQIEKVKNKTLIIWGKEDRIVNSNIALRLHRDLPDSVLHQIPDCGHLPHVEKPDVTAQTILKFVRSVDLC
ncbi:alpha/beta-Hydrolases superfamily protein [Wolffia australiana]